MPISSRGEPLNIALSSRSVQRLILQSKYEEKFNLEQVATDNPATQVQEGD